MSPRERITRNPAVCGGHPVIAGTRVLVRAILGHLAHGDAVETLLREYPSVTEEDVRAVIAFAAAAPAEDLPAPPPLPPRHQGGMRLELDENLPASAATRLRALAWLSEPDAKGWARCVIVATPQKVRVLRPPASESYVVRGSRALLAKRTSSARASSSSLPPPPERAPARPGEVAPPLSASAAPPNRLPGPDPRLGDLDGDPMDDAVA